MVNATDNKNYARTILANAHNVCCVDWWSRDDVENHIDRKITDEEWVKVSNQLEALAKSDFEDVTYALEMVGLR
tara:strand:+ start:329 stop:550 length:222 start_codon:yes stop_codon:yes gene_type:complete